MNDSSERRILFINPSQVNPFADPIRAHIECLGTVKELPEIGGHFEADCIIFAGIKQLLASSEEVLRQLEKLTIPLIVVSGAPLLAFELSPALRARITVIHSKTLADGDLGQKLSNAIHHK